MKMLLMIIPLLGTLMMSGDPVVAILMKTQVADGEPLHFSILAKEADSLKYAFWFRTSEKEWIPREDSATVDVRGLVGVHSIFKTCELQQGGTWLELQQCHPRWVLGYWQIRVEAWRWEDGKRVSTPKKKTFRVREHF
jgi:hypothetical protein